MTTSETSKAKTYKIWTWVLSIAVPVVVALLFGVRIPGVDRLGFLPPIYASINGLTSILLVLALFQIKKGNIKGHERLIKTCIVLSVLFLGMYVAYHMTADSTSYGGEGVLRWIYFTILISHIFLSIVVIPFVLVTYTRAILGNYKMHRKIAKYTFPIWLYVAVTGVIVYLMISPYY